MDLRTFRKQRGLTQDHIGVLAGLDASTVSLIESGQVQARPATVVKLARALGVKATRMQAMCDAHRQAARADDPHPDGAMRRAAASGP